MTSQPLPQDRSFDDDVHPSRSVLVVDDEIVVRDLMSRWLQASGFPVASAASAEEALTLMETFPAAVALCDIRMPGHDGMWLADRIREKHPETAVIMATGVHEVGAAAASLRQGVVDYLTKPFGRDRLRDAVVRGLEWHRSARDSRSWRERLEMEVEGRHRHLVDMVAGLGVDSDEGVDGMVALLTRGVPEASAHARRVSELASRIAHAMGLPAHDVATIGRGGLLHDLGKLAMPDALLRKPAPLTAEERAIIRRHPALGARLVAGLPFLHEAAAIVHDVQERLDGLGYPAGIRGPAVSIGARIVAAAEAYDTMIRARVFRDAISPADALLEMERCSGTQFDPEVVRVLETLVAPH